VLETWNATVQVQLETIEGTLLFEGVGAHTGLEVIGDLPWLMQE
jgi:tocopherol cyclase